MAWEEGLEKANNLLNLLTQKYKQKNFSMISRYRSPLQESQVHLMVKNECDHANRSGGGKTS